MAIKEFRSLNFGGEDTYVPIQSDWNARESEPGYIKNRTHYEGYDFDPITWDGDTDGLPCVVHLENSYYKVAELPYNIPEDYLAKQPSDIPVIFNGKKYVSSGTTNLFENGDNMNGISGTLFRIAPDDDPNNKIAGFAIICKENVKPYMQDTVFAETGIYFVKNDAGEFCSWFAGMFAVHKLDEKYLPNKVYIFSEYDGIVNVSGVSSNDDVTAILNYVRNPYISCIYAMEEFDPQAGTLKQAQSKCIASTYDLNFMTGQESIQLLFLHPITGEQIKVLANIVLDSNGSFAGIEASRVYDEQVN